MFRAANPLSVFLTPALPRPEEEFWVRLLKDKVQEKGQIKIDWDKVRCPQCELRVEMAVSHWLSTLHTRLSSRVTHNANGRMHIGGKKSTLVRTDMSDT